MKEEPCLNGDDTATPSGATDHRNTDRTHIDSRSTETTSVSTWVVARVQGTSLVRVATATEVDSLTNDGGQMLLNLLKSRAAAIADAADAAGASGVDDVGNSIKRDETGKPNEECSKDDECRLLSRVCESQCSVCVFDLCISICLYASVPVRFVTTHFANNIHCLTVERSLSVMPPAAAFRCARSLVRRRLAAGN